MELPLPPISRYDKAARYLLQLPAGAGLFSWLLRLTPAEFRFERWLPTQLTWPGVPERLCDAIAELTDLERGGTPVAALVEVQTQPDPNMTGRLFLAGGLLWLTLKPTTLPGDRYGLLGVVLNLTGVGDCARHYPMGSAEWKLRPVEINLETRDAGLVLEEIATGTAPREFLAFIQLMRRGDEVGILHRWREIVDTDPDPQRRSDYALARLFAERVQRRALWESVMEGLDMIESPMIAELLAETEAKTRAKTRAETLVRLLRKRFGELPEELVASMHACVDVGLLDRWLDATVEVESLETFRKQTGL